MPNSIVINSIFHCFQSKNTSHKNWQRRKMDGKRPIMRTAARRFEAQRPIFDVEFGFVVRFIRAPTMTRPSSTALLSRFPAGRFARFRLLTCNKTKQYSPTKRKGGKESLFLLLYRGEVGGSKSLFFSKKKKKKTNSNERERRFFFTSENRTNEKKNDVFSSSTVIIIFFFCP